MFVWERKTRILWLLLTVVLLTADGKVVSAQDGDFQIGDTIEYQFLGKKQEGEIIKFARGSNWPVVKLEFNGTTRDHMVPTRRAKLVKRAGAAGGNGSSDAMTTDMREWQDATGKFKIQAKMISFNDGVVELEKADRRVIKLPLAKLSDQDQQFLKDLEKKASQDNPFVGGAMKSDPKKPKAESGVAASKGINSIKPQMALNQLTLKKLGWVYQPNPRETQSQSNRVLNLVSSAAGRTSIHNRPAGNVFNSDKTIAAVGFANPFSKKTDVFVIDLVKGSVMAQGVLDYEQATVAAVNADGTTIVTILQRRGRDPGRLDFWDVPRGFENVTSWQTGSGQRSDPEFAPQTAAFVGDEKLVTVGKNLASWDIGEGTADFSIPLSTSTAITRNSLAGQFSPSGEEIAMSIGNAVNVIRVATGESIATIDVEQPVSALAFSDSGKFLAGLSPSDSSIWVWNMETNELAQELTAQNGTGSTLRWIGQNHLLVGQALIDIKLRATVWTFNFRGTIASAQDGRHWLLTKEKFIPVELSPPSLATKTASLDAKSILAMEPGSEVAIEMQLPFTAAEQQEIRRKLTSILAANSIKVNDAAKLKLVCKVTMGKQDTRRYIGSGSVTYVPNNGSIEFISEGHKLWARTKFFGPSTMMMVGRDENIQTATDRLCKPKPSFFMDVKLPKYLTKLPGGKPLGTSTL